MTRFGMVTGTFDGPTGRMAQDQYNLITHYLGGVLHTTQYVLIQHITSHPNAEGVSDAQINTGRSTEIRFR